MTLDYLQQEEVQLRSCRYIDTTQAGLVCGALMECKATKIVGISIARKNPRGGQVVADSVKEYLAEKGFVFSQEQIENAVIFDDSFVGEGYGKKSEAVDSAITAVMCKHGVPMDSTYVGKAYWGMQQFIENNSIEDKNILFIHTGGTPLFFDDLKRMGVVLKRAQYFITCGGKTLGRLCLEETYVTQSLILNEKLPKNLQDALYGRQMSLFELPAFSAFAG